MITGAKTDSDSLRLWFSITSAMTVEIPVLNRAAVALAADSASTALQATGLPKTFNTADKLFHLDGITPIGIMVYGSAKNKLASD